MELNVYCDGATQNNGKENAKGGIGIMWSNYEHLNVSEPLDISEVHTNQKAELIALTRTLQIINSNQKEFSEIKCFNIYSDSMYSINCITKWIPNWIKNGWKKSDKTPVQNVPYLKLLLENYNLCKDRIKLFHIASHTNLNDQHSLGNKHADKLATLSIT